MKEFAMMNYPFLFGDHFSAVSNEARLLYIEMMFFANNGFVANPKAILDSRNYPIDVLNELIANGDVLKLPDRSEVFITSYFIHNPGFKPASWKNTPFAIYWMGKLHVKKNGVATFKPQVDDDPVVVEEESTEGDRPLTPEEKEEFIKELPPIPSVDWNKADPNSKF